MTEDPTPGPRRRRADAQRNVDALLKAARAVFDTSGVDAPAKEITDLAGGRMVGVLVDGLRCRDGQARP